MPIDYDSLNEGDSLDAASLNSRFTELAGAGQGINDLAQRDVERYALRQEHLPAIITASDFPNGFSALGPVSTGAIVYNNGINVSSLPPADYQLMGVVAGVTGAPAPYGPTTIGIDQGWRIIADPTVGAPFYSRPAEIEFNTLGTELGPYKGILARLGANLVSGGPSPGGSVLADAALIAIGFTDGAGGRHIIERSIRWFSMCAKFKGSLDTFTVINSDDVSALGIDSIFGAIASGSFDVNRAGISDLAITYYNLDILPIRAGNLT